MEPMGGDADVTLTLINPKAPSFQNDYLECHSNTATNTEPLRHLQALRLRPKLVINACTRAKVSPQTLKAT